MLGMTNMKISASQYATTLYELTLDKSKPEIDSVTKKFTEMLIKNHHLKMAKKIIEKFNGIYNRKNGIIEAEVATARELESSQVHKVESFIKEKYKAKEVVIKNKIDESIKGGIIIKIGDEIIDASLKNSLTNLSKLLKV